MTEHDSALAKYNIPVRNDDFSQRAVEVTEELEWLNSNTPGVCVKFIEAAKTGHPRLTMLIRFDPGSHYDLSQHHGGEEFLVLDGSLRDEIGQYHPGYYVRNPTGTPHNPVSDDGCLLFLKLGEFSDDDREHRVIDTNENDAWLPGPIDGTSVLPLHMHDSRSVFMIRWDEEADFKPGLDPQGEELFITAGMLQDEHGYYQAGSWIRNPVPVWQSWKGHKNTIAYYKNGHFPK